MESSRRLFFTRTAILFVSAVMLLGIFFAISFFGAYMGRMAEIDERCATADPFEERVGCVADLALEKKDAAYCWDGGIFSPNPGICMSIFAQQAPSASLCETIFKPGQRSECLARFE